MIFYYSSAIFNDIGLPLATSLKLGGCASVVFTVGSWLGIFLIDRVGRKKLLISGSVTILITYAVYLPMIKYASAADLWVAFAMMCILAAAVGWSWLSVPWVLGAELLPVRYRHIGGAMAGFSNWTFTFIVGKLLCSSLFLPTARLTTRTTQTVKTGPIGLAHDGWKFYLLFVCCTVLSIPAIWYLYPETMGLTLEEIDVLFVKDTRGTQELVEKAAQVHHHELGKVVPREEQGPNAPIPDITRL